MHSLNQLQEILEVDQVVAFEDKFMVRKVRPQHVGFFYESSDNSDHFASVISLRLDNEGIKHEIIRNGVKGTPSKRIRPVSQSNHFWAIFRILPE